MQLHQWWLGVVYIIMPPTTSWQIHLKLMVSTRAVHHPLGVAEKRTQSWKVRVCLGIDCCEEGV